jgi:5-bromo-4-chloroindolyl phosphate hydrolysis protein
MAHDLLTRGRAWAATVKAAALFILPAPLSLAAVAALILGDLPRLFMTGGALACLWIAGVIAWNGLAAEARYWLGIRPDPPVVPLKLVSAVMTALGVALAAIAAGHTLAATLVFASLAVAGHIAFYGRDLRPRRVEVAIVDGVDIAAVTQQLKQGYRRLRAIDAASYAIAAPELGDRLKRISGIGRSILGHIERDPADAARARRFLHLYLESAERVTTEYASTHAQVRHAPLDENFRELLVEMERKFAEQQRRLVEHDVTSLDVDIEVLNTRLKSEGLG